MDDQGFKEFVEKLSEKYEEETKAKDQLQRMELLICPPLLIGMHIFQLLHPATLPTVLLGVRPFPQDHTAGNIAAAKRSLLVQRGIEGKVNCLVTHTIASALNLASKKSLAQTPGLEELCTRVRKAMTYR